MEVHPVLTRKDRTSSRVKLMYDKAVNTCPLDVYESKGEDTGFETRKNESDQLSIGKGCQ
jgi:hypothetical protein